MCWRAFPPEESEDPSCGVLELRIIQRDAGADRDVQAPQEAQNAPRIMCLSVRQVQLQMSKWRAIMPCSFL